MKKWVVILCILLVLSGGFYIALTSNTDRQAILFDVGYLLDDDPETYVYETREQHRGYMHLYQHTDGAIAYLDRGDRDGRVIVLLHGTPTNSWLYRHVVSGLIDQGYRVIVPDMLGFGASTKVDSSLLLSSRQQASRLMDLLNYLEIETFVLGAHDQGSLWMRETVLRNPKRIESLIIFNSIVTEDAFQTMAGYGTPNLITKAVSWGMGQSYLGTFMARIALKNGLVNKTVVTPMMIEGYQSPLRAGSDYTYYAFISSFGPVFSLLEELADSSTVTQQIRAVVIWGGQDEILRNEVALPELQKMFLISERDVTVFSDAKHFIQEEKPFEIVEAIDEFLERYTPPSKK